MSFAFNRQTVAELKDAKLGAYWDPDDRVSRCPLHREDDAEELSEDLGYTVRRVDQAERPGAVSKPPVAFFERVPAHLRRPVYLALIKIVHPDVGEDTRFAQELNTAWDQIKEERT